ncbi:MAG: histidine kinase [Desulfovibrio sp.]|nr:histidine kinase [Desulfovibrio sp.]
MTSNATTSPAPDILLLSESEAMGNLDKRALREAGAGHVENMTSGVAAARLLAGLKRDAHGFYPDLVVCTQRLADMSGEQFCAIVRLHPLLLDMPVLLILPHDNEVEQLKTLGCGASALLARPYSVVVLKQHLEILGAARPSLAELERAGRLADTKAFDEALATYGILLKPVRAPEDYFRVGMQCLQEGKWNNALNAFQKALRGALIRGKAELGMAVAWKGKGDMERYRIYLAKAAATFVRASQWSRARAVYGRLLQEDPDARSPFLAEAVQHMRQGNYEEAADILAQGYSVTPRKQIRDKLALVCLASTKPQEALHAMEEMLELALGADAGEVLGAEIRTKLDELARQMEQKRQEEAAERQRLARQNAHRNEGGMAGQGQSQRQDSSHGPDHNKSGDRSACAPADGMAADSDNHAIAPLDVHHRPARGSNNGRPSIPDFEVDPEEEEQFSGGLSDLFSVMKYTWRMARKH